MSATTPLPEPVLQHADPVAAFLAAHDRGVPVTLGTSGTSGTARAVVRTTQSWVSSFPHVTRLSGIGPAARVWVPGPLAATMNLFGVVHARWAGAEVVDTPGPATHAHLSPAALHRLLDDGGFADGLTVVVAGDRLTPSLASRATRAGVSCRHYYGAAELSFVAWGADAGSLRAFPGVDVEVRDGEIWVRSPYLCAGYDGPPGPLRRTGDGFATVGDRGRLHGDRLTVLGRPGAVTTAGATVHLAEVEARLRPAAGGEVHLVGLPDDRLGSILAVALTDDRDHPGLLATARAGLVGAHRPRLWFHVPDPPRTDAGKVDRDALAGLLQQPDARARRLA